LVITLVLFAPGGLIPTGAEVEEEGAASRIGVSADRFELVEEKGEFRILTLDPLSQPIPLPRSWLIPPEELARAEVKYVAGFEYSNRVSSFPIGDGFLGLHLSSYEIQTSGSARAAEGRDVFLILDPIRNQGVRLGLSLPNSKGRVRLGGCFSAWYSRIQVGDVDCDRRLDLAVEEMRVDCSVPEEGGPTHGVFYRGPLRWYLQNDAGWELDAEYEGRLPCGGLEELPLVGLAKDPVHFATDRLRSEKILFDRSVEVPTAGLSLRVPAEWRVDPEPNGVEEFTA